MGWTMMGWAATWMLYTPWRFKWTKPENFLAQTYVMPEGHLSRIIMSF